MDLGGVDGGEGNSIGWIEEGEEGSCLTGEERGKKTTGWKGDIGEGEVGFVGEEDGNVSSLIGEDRACLVGEVGGGEADFEGESGGEGEGDLVGESGGDEEVNLMGDEGGR